MPGDYFHAFFFVLPVFKCQLDSAALIVPPVSCPAAGNMIMSFLYLNEVYKGKGWKVQWQWVAKPQQLRKQAEQKKTKHEQVKHAKQIPVKTARYRNAR